MEKNRNIKRTAFGIISAIIIVLLLITIINNTQIVQLTQLKANSNRQMMGYILKTNNKVIVIDGGTKDDAENLKIHINKYGGKVDYWFMTHLHDDHLGAFTEIVKDENVEICNIYASLNDKEWYRVNEPSRYDFAEEFLNILSDEKIKNKVHSPDLNEKLTIDNIKVEILGIRNPEITENPGNEQSMVIRFDTHKSSMIILGDTGVKSSEKLLNNQKEKLDCDIVQMAHHGQNGATRELYQAISPKICMWPTPEWLWNNDPGTGYNTGIWKTIETRSWMEELNVKNNYIEKDGDIIIEI